MISTAISSATDTTDFPHYVSAQLHCHSSIEGPASIGAHCYEARRAGVDVVWLTDHDTRISLCIGGPFVDRFDFEAPELTARVARVKQGGQAGEIGVGWQVSHRDPALEGGAALSRETCFAGTQSLRLDAAVARSADEASPDVPEDWQSLFLDFRADSKMHSRPLLAGVRVALAVRLEEASPHDAEAWLDLTLTEQPPDLRQSRLRYLLHGSDADHAPHPVHDDRYRIRTISLAAPSGEWVRHEIDPARDAEPDGLGGIDNAMTGLRLVVRVRRSGNIRLYVDDLTIRHERAGNELHARQRAHAKELAALHGVTCHVAQEISWAGQHKNAWGSAAPLMDYAGCPGGFSHADGVAWAKRHGVPFSLNHPFSHYKLDPNDTAARDVELERRVAEYTEHRAYGATTLEVGFPAGRHHFPLVDYLRLWDGLSRAGVVISGSGSSDAHSARVGWQNGNNFATRIRASSTEEDVLLAGLRSGNFYPADPVRFRSRLWLRDSAGHRMGQVVPLSGDAGPLEALVTLGAAEPHWQLCWVVDGERQAPIALGAGLVTQRLPVAPSRSGPTFVRAEIWDPTLLPDGAPRETPVDDPTRGRCLALTNPIWYFPGTVPADIAPERLAE